MNGILKTLDDHVLCDKEGRLTLKEQPRKQANSQVQDTEEAVFNDFKTHTESIVENIHNAATQRMDNKYEAEIIRLQAQLEELNNEVSKIPVLKQRIEDQSLKLEAKDRKLKRYE